MKTATCIIFALFVIIAMFTARVLQFRIVGSAVQKWKGESVRN